MLIIAVSLGVGAASPAAAVPLALVGKFFACAAFNLIYVQTGELFETASRNTAFGMCSSFARVGSILASPMARILGPEACMLVFSATSLTASVLCWLVTPETLGRSLGQSMDNREGGVRASMAEGGAPRKVDLSPGGVELRDGAKVNASFTYGRYCSTVYSTTPPRSASRARAPASAPRRQNRPSRPSDRRPSTSPPTVTRWRRPAYAAGRGGGGARRRRAPSRRPRT